jgi:hypothetical protein
VALTSRGSSLPPVSTTKSTPSPVALRQKRISARSERASRHTRRSRRTRFSRWGPPGSGSPARCSASPASPPVDLGALDETLGAAHRIGRKAKEQERHFQEVQVPVSRRLGESDIPGQLGVIQHLSQPEAGGPHQPTEVRERGNGGKDLEVSLQVRPHVPLEPRRPLRRPGHLQRGDREPSTPRELPPVLSGPPAVRRRSNQSRSAVPRSSSQSRNDPAPAALCGSSARGSRDDHGGHDPEVVGEFRLQVARKQVRDGRQVNSRSEWYPCTI